eukprot:2810485-Rhodomonas_salina.1
MPVQDLSSTAFVTTVIERYSLCQYCASSIAYVSTAAVLTEDITLRGSRMGSGLRAEDYSLKGLGLRA